MSYEGFTQYLCKNGHLHELDCYMDDLKICPVCSEKIVWENSVDVTNGSFDEIDGKEVRIDGYVELKIKSRRKCEHCNSILEMTYEIPEKEGV